MVTRGEREEGKNNLEFGSNRYTLLYTRARALIAQLARIQPAGQGDPGLIPGLECPLAEERDDCIQYSSAPGGSSGKETL